MSSVQKIQHKRIEVEVFLTIVPQQEHKPTMHILPAQTELSDFEKEWVEAIPTEQARELSIAHLKQKWKEVYGLCEL